MIASTHAVTIALFRYVVWSLMMRLKVGTLDEPTEFRHAAA